MNKVEEKRALSQNTINLYNANLKRMNVMGIKFDGTMGINSIIRLLKPLYSKSTMGTYFASIVWKIKNGQCINYKQKRLLNSLATKQKKISESIDKQYKNNKLTPNEKKKFIDWDIILKIYDILNKNKDKSFDDYKDFIMLSLYVINENGPRRALDYSNMYCVKNREDDKTKNYYVYGNNDPYFIFNVYKTQSTYKTQIIHTDKSLSTLLNIYIKKFNIIGSLLNLSDIAFKTRLTNIFKRHVNKSVGVSIIRKAFLSYYTLDGATIAEKEALAITMGHSKNTQERYKKMDKIKQPIVVEIPRPKKGRKKTYTDEEAIISEKERKKRWREKNKETIKISNQKYYKDHKDN